VKAYKPAYGELLNSGVPDEGEHHPLGKGGSSRKNCEKEN